MRLAGTFWTCLALALSTYADRPPKKPGLYRPYRCWIDKCMAGPRGPCGTVGVGLANNNQTDSMCERRLTCDEKSLANLDKVCLSHCKMSAGTSNAGNKRKRKCQTMENEYAKKNILEFSKCYDPRTEEEKAECGGLLTNCNKEKRLCIEQQKCNGKPTNQKKKKCRNGCRCKFVKAKQCWIRYHRFLKREEGKCKPILTDCQQEEEEICLKKRKCDDELTDQKKDQCREECEEYKCDHVAPQSYLGV